jgi:hypothetical protein
VTGTFAIVYCAAMLALFGVVVFFTRPDGRRLLGAVAAVLVFTALSAPIDALAARQGWWTYPSPPTTLVYLGQSFEFVGTLALIGWRVGRRFGVRGLAVLCAVVCAVGLVRDLSVAAATQMIRFGPLPASLVADLGAWAVVVAVALGVSRLVGGPD